jgi:flavin reductase (DIM6/NTAB) family NADH-FMN oxidoreductase RutF
MEIDLSTLSGTQQYLWMIGCIVPRPIAWITTINEHGVVNLAPFSFFNGVSSEPPIVSVAIGHRNPMKDTLRNVLANNEAVIHIAYGDALEHIHQSGAEYPAQVSEVDALHLATVPAQKVRVPRLKQAQVALECRLLQTIPVGQPATTLCLFEIIHLHVDDAVIGAHGLPDAQKLRAPARLGGRSYLTTDNWSVITLAAQKVPEALR